MHEHSNQYRLRLSGGPPIRLALLHVVNNPEMPVTARKSYSLYSGETEAMVQWWYGHNAVGFSDCRLPRIMRHFVPKQAKRPVYSCRLSIVHSGR